MTDDESVQVANELVRAFNAHDVERMGALLSETFLVVSPEGPIGPYGWKARTAEYFKSFPDSAWTDVRITGDSEHFLVEVLWTGSQEVPPTNRTMRLPVTLHGLIKRHKIETLRLDYDSVTVREQLGLAVEPPKDVPTAAPVRSSVPATAKEPDRSRRSDETAPRVSSSR